MTAFTSARERRLWVWALAVVVAIYSTLGVARVGVELLRERNLLRLTVAMLLLGVGLALAVGLMRSRPGRREVVVAIGFSIAYAALLVWMERPEERLHLLEYGLVAVLIHLALEERRQNGGHTPGPSWLLAIVGTATLGWIDEGIQAVLPSRVYDLRDVALNAVAAALAITATAALASARRRPDRG